MKHRTGRYQISRMRLWLQYLLFSTGILRLKRLLQRNKVTILGYHTIQTPDLLKEILGLGATREMFEEQMDYLARNHPVISMPQLLEWIETGRRIPAGSIVITFDDGYRDVYEDAFPILNLLRLPATVFLTVDCIGTQIPVWTNRLYAVIRSARKQKINFRMSSDDWTELDLSTGPVRTRSTLIISQWLKSMSPEMRDEKLRGLVQQLESDMPEDPSDLIPMLTWDQVAALDQAGWTIGSHTKSHPILSQCTESRQWDEIAGSKAMIESRLAKKCEVFAYPNGQGGDYTELTVELIRRAGYRAGFTFSGGAARRPLDPHRVSRQPIFEVPVYSFAAGLV